MSFRRPALRLADGGSRRAAIAGGMPRSLVPLPARLSRMGLSVAQLLEQLSRVPDWNLLRERFPGLEPDDVRDALDYAARHGFSGPVPAGLSHFT